MPCTSAMAGIPTAFQRHVPVDHGGQQFTSATHFPAVRARPSIIPRVHNHDNPPGRGIMEYGLWIIVIRVLINTLWTLANTHSGPYQLHYLLDYMYSKARASSSWQGRRNRTGRGAMAAPLFRPFFFFFFFFLAHCNKARRSKRKRGKSLSPIVVCCRIKSPCTLKWHQMLGNACNRLQFLNFFPGEGNVCPRS